MRRRSSGGAWPEMASFFGIEDWFYRDVASLSGGQKQMLNLASVMVMQPDLLILDEPTSQLDPIAASEFLSVLGKINRELGTTVLLCEHRLEEAFALCSRRGGARSWDIALRRETGGDWRNAAHLRP